MTCRRIRSVALSLLALTLMAGSFSIPARAQIITEQGPRKPRVKKPKVAKPPRVRPQKPGEPGPAPAVTPVAAPAAGTPERTVRSGPLPRTLSELREQTTDSRIAADLDAIDGWAAKASALPGATADAWRAAAAKAWLEAAEAEYTDNDRQGFPQACFERAVALVSEIESGKAPVDSSNAPAAVVPRGSMKVADSLYARLAQLKVNPGFRCAREPIARMEVELAWSGNEQLDQGECRSSPHLARATELAQAAQRLCETCLPPAVAKVEEPPAPVPADTMRVVHAPVPTQEELRIPRNVHFALNQFDISPASRTVIAGIVTLLRKYPTVTTRLVGHADTRGSAEHNLALSKRRVDAARAVFVEMGIDSARITTDYRGSSETYALEDSKRGFALNRRVEMVFVDQDGHDLHGERQEGDLQLEGEGTRPSLNPGQRPAPRRPIPTRTRSARVDTQHTPATPSGR